MKVEGTDKPTLLFLAHAVPDPGDVDGDTECRRLWQLLTLAGRTHTVTAVCLADRAIGLATWRAAAKQCRHLIIEPPSVLARAASLLPAASGGGAVAMRLRCRAARRTLRELSAGAFDGVVASHPSLHQVGRCVDARWRAVDLGAVSHFNVSESERVTADADVILVPHARTAAAISINAPRCVLFNEHHAPASLAPEAPATLGKLTPLADEEPPQRKAA